MILIIASFQLYMEKRWLVQMAKGRGKLVEILRKSKIFNYQGYIILNFKARQCGGQSFLTRKKMVSSNQVK